MSQRKNALIASLTGGLLVLAFIFHFADLFTLKDYSLIAATLIAGYFISTRAFQALSMKGLSMQLLVTIAVVGALIIGEYVESAAVTFLFIFGAYLETRTLERTRSSLRDLIDMTPGEATVLRPEGNIKVLADDIEKGDRVLIRSGGKVAVDGTIVAGPARIVEAAITGESVDRKSTRLNSSH